MFVGAFAAAAGALVLDGATGFGTVVWANDGAAYRNAKPIINERWIIIFTSQETRKYVHVDLTRVTVSELTWARCRKILRGLALEDLARFRHQSVPSAMSAMWPGQAHITVIKAVYIIAVCRILFKNPSLGSPDTTRR
jgi:hypothetical protein